MGLMMLPSPRFILEKPLPSVRPTIITLLIASPALGGVGGGFL